MGEITIKIPNRKNRAYVFTDANQAEDLIEALDDSDSVVRLKRNPATLTKQQKQDHSDGRSADRVISRRRRTYSSSEVKAILGI